MKIYIDPGHGGTDPGATGNGIKEKDVTLQLAKAIQEELLQRYPDVQTKMSRETDSTKSLVDRTNEANRWNADFFLSIHCNAFNGVANGYEDFIYNKLPAGSRTPVIQQAVHEEVSQTSGLKNRGRKQANYHVLRETNMPAVLTENGFIDNSHDAAKMKDADWIKEVANAHVTGIAAAFRLTPSAKFYKVVTGTFRSRLRATAQLKRLKQAGIDAFVAQGENGLYMVRTGTFRSNRNAENHLRTLQDAGFESYII